jgi:hypothetical protein
LILGLAVVSVENHFDCFLLVVVLLGIAPGDGEKVSFV